MMQTKECKQIKNRVKENKIENYFKKENRQSLWNQMNRLDFGLFEVESKNINMAILKSLFEAPASRMPVEEVWIQ